MRKMLAALAMLGSTALIVPALAQYDNTMNDEDTADDSAASVAGETDEGTVDDDDVPGELPETGGGWGARQ